MSVKLSERWSAFFQSQPETGMGYVIVTAKLKDGRQFERVCVLGGVITSVDGKSHIPCTEAEIDGFTVTHDKQNFAP